MKIHGYQAKELFRNNHIPVPDGYVATSPHVREALPTLIRNVEEKKTSPIAAAGSLLAFLYTQNGN